METPTQAKPLPYFFIGKALASQRVKAYEAVKHRLLTEKMGKPDTKNIWYSKKHIAQLLEEIVHAEGDGIRFYFGTYEEGHQFAGQTCICMLITKEKIVGDDIFHENVLIENAPDFAMRSSASRELKIMPDDGNDPKRKRELNYGSPCPPLCDEGLPKFP
jgi:hypothetical protein